MLKGIAFIQAAVDNLILSFTARKVVAIRFIL